jgi:hypothetical protein
MRFIFLFLIFFFNYQYLGAVEFLGKFEQGSFILGKTKPNSKVKIDNKKIRKIMLLLLLKKMEKQKQLKKKF